MTEEQKVKKAIKNNKCPECGAKLHHQSGCISCSKCYFSLCG